MNNVSLFLNTKIEGSGALAWIGDKGLTPFRYLFNGRTVRITPRDGTSEVSIHHVQSFHKWGRFNLSKTDRDLRSSETRISKIHNFAAIVLLIPGLVLSVFKLLAYVFSDLSQRQSLAKEHFTPINREIGSVAHPITNIGELQQALTVEKNKPKHQPTDALIIHGDGNLAINNDPGILALNPMKLILEGAQIVHRPTAIERLDDAMSRTRKWQVASIRGATPRDSFVNSHAVSSPEEALVVTAPLRDWTSCKRYHMVFTMARPLQAGA